MRLKRNPDNDWAPASAAHTGPAHVETLTFRNVPEESTRVAVLESGQAHVADLIPPQNLPAFRQSPSFGLLEKELLETNYSLALNPPPDPALGHGRAHTVARPPLRVVLSGGVARGRGVRALGGVYAHPDPLTIR